MLEHPACVLVHTGFMKIDAEGRELAHAAGLAQAALEGMCLAKLLRGSNHRDRIGDGSAHGPGLSPFPCGAPQCRGLGPLAASGGAGTIWIRRGAVGPVQGSSFEQVRQPGADGCGARRDHGACAGPGTGPRRPSNRKGRAPPGAHSPRPRGLRSGQTRGGQVAFHLPAFPGWASPSGGDWRRRCFQVALVAPYAMVARQGRHQLTPFTRRSRRRRPPSAVQPPAASQNWRRHVRGPRGQAGADVPESGTTRPGHSRAPRRRAQRRGYR